MSFLIFDKFHGEKIIPNGFNMSLSELEHHTYDIVKKHNISFTLPRTGPFCQEKMIPIPVAAYLSHQQFFDNNGKVYYAFSLNRNIQEYAELVLEGMNDWINFCNPQIIELIKQNKITLVLEAVIEDIDLSTVDRIVKNLKYHKIENFQIWSCYGPPDSKFLGNYSYLKKYFVDIPLQERITTDFYPVTHYQSSKIKKFIYLCRRINDERTGYFAFLVQNNLLDQGFVSMPGFDSMSRMPILEWIKHPHRMFDRFTKQILIDYFESNPNGLKLDSDIVDDIGRLPGHDNYLGFVDPPNLEPYYAQSYISLIAEGSMAQDQYMITEKTYRAILYKHPFFILGPTHILKALQRRGYKTFDTLWSEDYDNEQLDRRRIAYALAEFKRVLDTDLEDLYQKACPILEHNYNLLMERSTSKIKI